MGFLDVARGVTKGVAMAGGNQAAVNDIGDQQAAAEQQKKFKLQQQIAPLGLALQGLKSRLTAAADPNDPTKALPGKEAEYNLAHDNMADVIGKMRMLMYPPPKEDAHGLSYLAHRATDKMHITNHAVDDYNQAQQAKKDTYDARIRQDVANQVQSIPAPEPGALTPQELRDKHLIEAKLKEGIGTWKPAAETEAQRIRDDFASYQKENPDFTGTLQAWVAGERAKGRLQTAGLQYDKNTGQVLDKSTGVRYSRGEADNPPEVEAMLDQADALTEKNHAFQLKMAAMRGASYNNSKPLNVLDTANGNAPGTVSFGDMKAQPGRYLPAGPGDKAITKENLMQDIAGTSKLTRDAITKLKEDFPPEMKIKIAAAMRADDPHAALDQLMASGATGALTPDQQDFLIASRQLAENAMAMRTILGGGQGSNDVRAAIRSTLPSLLSPDKQYATKQLDAFDATISRLHRGVPNVKLNEKPDTLFANPSLVVRPKGAAGTAKHEGKTYWVDKDGNNLGEKVQ